MNLESENKKWFSVEVETAVEATEAVEFALSENEAIGTEIDLLGKKDAKVVKVVGYFNEMPNLSFLETKIKEAFEIYEISSSASFSLSANEVENRDWLAEWKKHWKPTETAKFIIAPTWENIENPTKIVIKIEPSMAFGTGTHETTKLCLKAIEENFRENQSFFDVGTGTGILAIAVAKLRKTDDSAKISGCDTDTDSIKIAVENAEFNQTENINFYVGTIEENADEFDFVCANLTAEVIVPLLPLLTAKFKQTLVLSGILSEQKEWLKAELKTLGYENLKIETDGEWISISIKK